MSLTRPLDRLLHFIFPPRCAFCGDLLPTDEGVCRRCAAALPLISGAVCPACGAEVSRCCCSGPTDYEGCVAPFYYEGPAKNAVLRLKFQAKASAARVLSGYLIAAVMERYGGTGIDGVCCVPLDRQSLSRRGYNQAELLAGPVAQALNVPFYPHGLIKSKPTKTQSSLPAAARRGNVLGVYGIHPDFRPAGLNLLLIDDVKTTGATLNECAKVLRAAGAAGVYCAVLAISAGKSRKIQR